MKKIEDRNEAARRQKESNRKAVAKYQEQFKRVNCRFTPELFEKIQKKIKESGQSTNTFIIEAIKEKLERK